MTPPRAKPAPLRATLEATAEAARCREAEVLFDRDKVIAALVRAADNGARVCVIAPSLAVDVRGTPAADKFEKWLAKQGLEWEWSQPESVAENGVEIGVRVRVSVSWQPPRTLAQ